MLSNLHFNDIQWLRQRFSQPLPGFKAQELMLSRVLPMPPEIPANARLSAVLCMLYPHNNTLNMLLMKRMADRTAHSGQVSFPGGRHEQEDKDLLTTALREATEEVGVQTSDLEILGALTSLYIPVSNFHVFPFVGYAPGRPKLSINREEVSYIIEAPVSDLFDDNNKIITGVRSPASPEILRKVRAYKLPDDNIIWGATAMIISELEVMLKQPSTTAV